MRSTGLNMQTQSYLELISIHPLQRATANIHENSVMNPPSGGGLEDLTGMCVESYRYNERHYKEMWMNGTIWDCRKKSGPNSAERVVSHYRPRLGHQRQANVRRPLPDCLDAHASVRVYQSARESTEGNYNLISFSLHYCINLSILLYANETRTQAQIIGLGGNTELQDVIALQTWKKIERITYA